MEKQKEEASIISKQREVWDCGSSLYDSFELKSLQHQLNSAIINSSSRTMSMPHLSHHRQPPPPPPPPSTCTNNKKHSKISRSLHKFLRSVFRPKTAHKSLSTHHGVFYVYDTTGALSTIPEVPETLPEFDGFSPEMKSLVKRSRSDRFMSTSSSSIGISCV
uniref:uncharacterized protein LOC122602384 n=1 Tax=Erigeron canadensis TaxID=72917 RepID=UPI001CB9AEE6|nr:uncharacterized protein LOC122602384 [Erigeron canadensis]